MVPYKPNKKPVMQECMCENCGDILGVWRDVDGVYMVKGGYGWKISPFE